MTVINKRIISSVLSTVMVSAMLPVLPAEAEENGAARQVEWLSRGGYGVAADGGVYLSWRLLGTEPIDRTFDIYRSGGLIASGIDATNYTDKNGTADDTYKIVPHGGEGLENDVFKPFKTAYKDVILDKPEGGTTPDGGAYTYIAYDASAADVDNDGQYELIVKWDPSNHQDNSNAGYTGNVYIDCYKLSGKKLWRIDLGRNIRAGDHYTQFIAYDFDGDGRAEMACRTAPGSKDGVGNYVSEKGAEIDGEALLWTDSVTGKEYTDESDMRSVSGGTLGKILEGPEWLTMFNGETGEAMQTVNYYPQRGRMTDWGDNFGNRCDRFLGGVAYLDGEHPSLIMSRGYYLRAAMAAYDWDGANFSIRWTRDDNAGKHNGTLYGNGNHQLSVCDADNDGKDEIVFGSTVVDDNGEILNSTDHGHGDALHASDFDNDGEQEIFSVHEDAIGYKNYGTELRKAKDGSIIKGIGASGDVGRGIMANFDDTNDTYSEFFSSATSKCYGADGTELGNKPSNVNPAFAAWWDGDLSRELVTGTHVIKFDTAEAVKTDVETGFTNINAVGKDAPILSADLLGDWREELCYPTTDNQTIRIYMTTDPTEYKMPTLMHDTQYRCAVAWQNVGYNQPPHTKFYVGRAALASNGKYLEPAAGFDIVKMTGEQPVIDSGDDDGGNDETYTVKIKAAGDISNTLHTYTDIEYAAQCSYAFPRYIIKGTTAYEADAGTAIRYGGAIANVIKDQDVEIIYTKKYNHVVFLDDLDNDTGKSANVRASNCMGSDNKPYTSSGKLEPGKSYTIVAGYCGTGRGSTLEADGKTIFTFKSNGGAWTADTVTGITVDNVSAITNTAGSGKAYDPLDTILVLEEVDPVTETINPLKPEGTGMSFINPASTAADKAVFSGVTKDTGGKSPSGYIEYTSPKNGKLTFNFSASAIKDSGNLPRVYYSKSKSNLNKNNASGIIASVTAANAPVAVSLDVKAGETYYLFGYCYNMTNSFTYTFTDLTLSYDPDDNTEEPPGIDCVKLTAVYDGSGVLRSVTAEPVTATEKENPSAQNTRLFYWDSLDTMTPISFE